MNDVVLLLLSFSSLVNSLLIMWIANYIKKSRVQLKEWESTAEALKLELWAKL